MENFEIIISLIAFVHGMVFGAYNKYRLKKITVFLSLFVSKSNDDVHRRLASSLLDDYLSFFGYARGFPDTEQYHFLYDDIDFYKSQRSWAFITRYFAVFFSTYVIVLIFIKLFFDKAV